ncbi:HD-GYP domain-containing protein [Roseateles terrae]|uniref:Nucleotidyltransferase with HDIG domain n=1 Tax=Roseateles terrae TaxID=431060 RepID=A0ABR6GQJ5_9BURK|nr:HD-GYP domain-containing protein [Roseateles terrae]MBB3194389.1 putative nucleotidyltransferase with HDIG domain [Roseateles terrae]OWQ88219.1 phosphodiesterase [Roseateles terrae]
MLKKIPTAQVSLGMYLHGLEGSWLSHPFWKTKFVLTDPADVKALLASGVPFCWIDASKGLDVGQSAPEPAPAPAAPEPSPAPAVAESPEAPAGSPPEAPALVKSTPNLSLDKQPATMGEEIERAAQVVNKSKEAVMSLFNEARLGKAVDAEQCLPLVEEVASSVARNPSALISLARLKTKDDYTYMHSVAVCALMVSLSRQLGLDEATTREAGLAGLLHDVGKMAMPLDVLNKPGALTDAEFAIMRGHPTRGYEMLKDGSAVPPSALDVALHHHEKMDGTGYPAKLAGEQITLMSRMGAVCDVYDAITSNRPYKNAWDPAASLARMAQWTGHFDPRVFQAFVKCVGIYPVGTLVKLQSGRLAVVLDQNTTALTQPRVRVFYSTKSQMPIPTQILDLSSASAGDRIVGREDPATWGFQRLDELWQKAPT